MANETPQTIVDKAQAAAKLAHEAAASAQTYADQIAAQAGLMAHTATGGAVDPFIFQLAIFVLAVFVGYYVVWSVTPALHTPLMSGANAIHGVVIIGAIIVMGEADPGNYLALILGFIAVILGTLNVVGGFVVTDRMLEMFSKKKKK